MIFSSIPFIGSWFPNSQTKAFGAPVDLDVSALKNGEKITIAWRGKPIFIIKRSETNVTDLQSLTDNLKDPYSLQQQQPIYINKKYRSLHKDFLVVEGICTHLGCIPLYKPKYKEINNSWIGGFFCPCHGSKFDLAGRVFKGVPASKNLLVPPHKYINEKIIRIGEDHIV